MSFDQSAPAEREEPSPPQLVCCRHDDPLSAPLTLSLPTDHPANRAFLELLASRQLQRSSPRRWLYVPYDQLSLELAPLDQGSEAWGLIFIESGAWERLRPYHIQRVAALSLNQRCFALEAAEAGFSVQYHIHEEPLEEQLERLLEGQALSSPLALREPAERALRYALDPLRASGALEPLPHPGWLSSAEDFERAVGANPPWRMDTFYRAMRKQSGLLMEGGRPVGGKWSYDAENRKPWRGEPEAPELPRFEGDRVSSAPREGLEAWLKAAYPDHPGELDLGALPASLEEHEALWRWAKERALPHFGPYEDAMSARESTLFHTRVSLSVNLGRLSARRLVEEVERLEVSLAGREGFIRQLIGWREFVRHVHLRTDGHRRGLSGPERVAAQPGDAGISTWLGATWRSRPWREGAEAAEAEGWRPRPQRVEDGGALPNAMSGGRAEPRGLPAVYWGERSGLRCLDSVVADVWREGWSHHITRLMVLANWATLLGASPRELSDWFWVAYIDAFDWVVEPNVLGMATYATEGLMTTKPYVSGAAYVHKMSDYCEGCQYRPKAKRGDERPACPMTELYWDFLSRNRPALTGNHRVALPLASEAKRSAAQREAGAARLEELWRQLSAE